MPTSIPSHPHSLKSASSQSPLSTEAPQIPTSGFLIHTPGASRVSSQHQLFLRCSKYSAYVPWRFFLPWYWEDSMIGHDWAVEIP